MVFSVGLWLLDTDRHTLLWDHEWRCGHIWMEGLSDLNVAYRVKWKGVDAAVISRCSTYDVTSGR